MLLYFIILIFSLALLHFYEIMSVDLSQKMRGYGGVIILLKFIHYKLFKIKLFSKHQVNNSLLIITLTTSVLIRNLLQ